jgi:tetratricopeptide (TPR) repeat protein
VLIARIDRLAEESRRAIQVASVIGREFALRLLARITEAGDIHHQVDELRSLELIYEKALHPELAYMFKHALTHDVAYESVVIERRRALHRGIGGVIEELYGDRLPEHYETLAHHYSRGEDWEKALLYHQHSAEKAAETHANRAVVQHCRAALAIVDRLSDVDADVRRRLNERIGRASFYLSEYAASALAYEEAAAQSKDPEARALNLGHASYSAFFGHRYDASKRDFDEALRYSREQGVPRGEAIALAVRGFYRGVHDQDLRGMGEDQHEALRICGQHPSDAIEGLAGTHLAMLAEWSGDYATARRRAESAIALGRRQRLPELIIFPSWFLGKILCCTGEFGNAIALLEEAHSLCDRIGDRAWKTRMLNTLGWCLAEIGAIEMARRYNEQAAALAREIGDPEILANAGVNLATNHLRLGHLDQALAHLEPIEAAAERNSDPWLRWRYIMHVRHARGLVDLARAEPVRALVSADEEVARARQYDSPKIEARAQTLRAAAFLRLDDRRAAIDALRDALSISERIGYRRGIWQAHGLLAQTLRRDGDLSSAAEHAARAQAAAEHAARSLRDDELRRQLLAEAASERV